MNDDHADAVAAYARAATGSERAGWRMTGIDPHGIDLRRRGEVARCAFDAPVTTPDEARRALIAMVQAARAA